MRLVLAEMTLYEGLTDMMQTLAIVYLAVAIGRTRK